MQRAIRPAWLLRQATELAGQPRGQPRNADLRRAVSASYYALYHHIVLNVVETLMPDCSEEHLLRSTRNFEHRGVKTVCGWVENPNTAPQPGVASMIGQNAYLLDVALTFPQLRLARMEADYDHLANFTKATTLARIRMASTAITNLDAAEGGAAHQAFVALLAMKANPAHRS